MIAEEIGKQWRNLGRELGVSEGRLDEIDDEHHGNTANKVHAMLWQFERLTVGPMHQFETLQIGLRHVRRRDMVSRMEKIFMNGQNAWLLCMFKQSLFKNMLCYKTITYICWILHTILNLYAHNIE